MEQLYIIIDYDKKYSPNWHGPVEYITAKFL